MWNCGWQSWRCKCRVGSVCGYAGMLATMGTVSTQPSTCRSTLTSYQHHTDQPPRTPHAPALSLPRRRRQPRPAAVCHHTIPTLLRVQQAVDMTSALSQPLVAVDHTAFQAAAEHAVRDDARALTHPPAFHHGCIALSSNHTVAASSMRPQSMCSHGHAAFHLPSSPTSSTSCRSTPHCFLCVPSRIPSHSSTHPASVAVRCWHRSWYERPTTSSDGCCATSARCAASH